MKKIISVIFALLLFCACLAEDERTAPSLVSVGTARKQDTSFVSLTAAEAAAFMELEDACQVSDYAMIISAKSLSLSFDENGSAVCTLNGEYGIYGLELSDYEGADEIEATLAKDVPESLMLCAARPISLAWTSNFTPAPFDIKLGDSFNTLLSVLNIGGITEDGRLLSPEDETKQIGTFYYGEDDTNIISLDFSGEDYIVTLTYTIKDGAVVLIELKLG